MMWGYDGGWGWGMLFGGLMMILFWAGLLLVIYRVINTVQANKGHASAPDMRGESAEDIAKRRFATGEIDEAEYDRILIRLSR